MKKCIIFCAAGFEKLAAPIGPEDYVLAADGGLRHLEQLKIRPNGIIGDFDSLGYEPEGAEVFPVEKDDTDAMLAAKKGLELGFTEFYFYGSLDGPRLDHTIANFQTLQYLADRGAVAYLIGNDYIVTAVKDGKITFPAGFEGIVSVFCLGADAEGVSIKGLYYELENGTLTAGFPLGVSNHFTGDPAQITVHSGTVVALWNTPNGFPGER
jgi:thiamine pyrophosphokinase